MLVTVIFSLIIVATIVKGSDIVVQTDNPIGPFDKNWKGLADQHMGPVPPTLASQIDAVETAITDWGIRKDSGYYRITISYKAARKMFPDSYPWATTDWDFDILDSWQGLFNSDRKIKIIFHLLGYPKWLMLPEDTVSVTPGSDRLVGDTKLPVYEGSIDSGLVRYSELITEFCNHFHSMGINFAMTIMAEPNLETHWTGTWDDANLYYKAFVDGVNASEGGDAIKVGGLVWAAGAQYGDNLDTLIEWAKYWDSYCKANNIRHDFICYHHYWRTPNRFDTVAQAFKSAFPNDEFWITEWNYKFHLLLPVEEYEEWVTGMSGATGNLEFIKNARGDNTHPVMTLYRVIGHFFGWGICHWRDASNWNYTATGHALKWLASFEDTELEISNNSPSVSARASSGNGNIKVLLWNHNSPIDTVNLTIPIGAETYNYEVWRMDRDSTVKSLFYRPFPPPYDDSTTIYLPVPYVIEQGSNDYGDFTREIVMDSNEIVYISIIQQPLSVKESGSKFRATNFSLKQNYPNPFNSQTAISYRVALQAMVTLRIYNPLGQVVRTLVDETKPPGRYSVVWDGKNGSGREAASGIYFYQLKAEVNDRMIRLTKNLLLLR